MNISLPPDQIPNGFNIYEDVEYDRYWDDSSRKKLDELEHALVSELLPTHGFRLIDLGCGFGRLSDCYVDRFDHLILFDGSLSLLRTAKSRLKGKGTFILGDINYLPFSAATFDAVIMIRVFHHLIDPEVTLSGIRQILCGGGCLVMNYSNKRNIAGILKWSSGKMRRNPFSIEPLSVEPNFSHYHPAHVDKLLQDTGFAISKYRGAGLVDKIYQFVKPGTRSTPSGLRVAPLLGKSIFAPWVFCKNIACKPDELNRITEIDEILICPICRSGLRRETAQFICLTCGRGYPIIEGIIDMRINE